MYVKLAVGTAAVPAIGVMRDICLLLTSSAPSVSDLVWCDPEASVVIDSTPAGWTYKGGTGSDTGTINTGATIPTITADTLYTLGVSAPCIDDTKEKCAVFNIQWLGANQSTSVRWTMSGAEDVASDGTMTNCGGFTTWNSAQGVNEPGSQSFDTNAGNVFHIVATPRGITIVQEGRGLCGVWETNETSVHTFYDTAPFVQYSHNDSSSVVKANQIVPSTSTTTAVNSGITTVFNVRNTATGVLYGTYDPTSNSSLSGGDLNRGSLWQNNPSLRMTSISESGLPLYQVSPIFFQCGELGYPVQYVTGINPIYWTAPYIGTSGDTISIGADDYVWLNCGAGFGVAVGTS